MDEPPCPAHSLLPGLIEPREELKLLFRVRIAIRRGEPKEDALSLFRGYTGGKDQYSEEALLTNGKREEMICLLLLFGRGELGEIRLTYVDDRLVQKQQNGIW